MTARSSLFNTLMLLLALAVMSQRVLLPFGQPALDAQGQLRFCLWPGSSLTPTDSAPALPQLDSDCPASTLTAPLLPATNLQNQAAWLDLQPPKKPFCCQLSTLASHHHEPRAPPART